MFHNFLGAVFVLSVLFIRICCTLCVFVVLGVFVILLCVFVVLGVFVVLYVYCIRCICCTLCVFVVLYVYLLY